MEQSPKPKLPKKPDPQFKWAIVYFVVTLLVLWGWQELFNQFAVRTIPYSQFKTHLQQHEVTEASVRQTEIVGRIVPSTQHTNAPLYTNAPSSNAIPSASQTNPSDIPSRRRAASAETKPFM